MSKPLPIDEKARDRATKNGDVYYVGHDGHVVSIPLASTFDVNGDRYIRKGLKYAKPGTAKNTKPEAATAAK